MRGELRRQAFIVALIAVAAGIVLLMGLAGIPWP